MLNQCHVINKKYLPWIIMIFIILFISILWYFDIWFYLKNPNVYVQI